MSDATWSGIRPEAQRLEVYNEGLLVYLFDASNLELLANSGADFQAGFADEESQVDPALRKLAREGQFVAYELFQDDEVSVEVVVGPPLSKKELKSARWLKPQKAFLKLPSGVLRVDTPNTLPIHEEEERDEPGIVQVPPGDYVLHLYRLDWNEMKNDGLTTDDHPWTGPQEVIVLTPLEQARPPRNASYLRFPQPADAIWKGRYTFEGSAFHGLGMTQYWWDNIHLNLDRSAEKQLGLEPGRMFRVEMGEHVFEVLYFGDIDMSFLIHVDYVRWTKTLAGDRKEFGVAYRFKGFPQFEHMIVFSRLAATTKFPIHARWVPAVVTLLHDRIAIPEAFR